MDIKKRDELISLYDIYKDLLTTKQKQYFEDYYYDDLSLGEIAEGSNVSRNAVYDMLKKTEAILDKYESVLKIYSKNTRIDYIISKNKDNKILEEIDKILKE